MFNGSIILAVALSPLVVERMPEDGFIIGRNIPNEPPPPKPVEQKKDAQDLPPIFTERPVFKPLKPPVEQVTTSNEQKEGGMVLDGQGGDDEVTEIIRETVKPPVPIFKAAVRDPRFARSFQPDYPVGMLQREIEGVVTIRVLIGTDGRVRQAQVISATEPDFARATERQAIKAWRFKAATRDGEPVEDWQTLTVRFDIT
jgi:protein TonB